jgi:hypothetical protein
MSDLLATHERWYATRNGERVFVETINLRGGKTVYFGVLNDGRIMTWSRNGVHTGESGDSSCDLVTEAQP